MIDIFYNIIYKNKILDIYRDLYLKYKKLFDNNIELLKDFYDKQYKLMYLSIDEQKELFDCYNLKIKFQSPSSKFKNLRIKLTH